MTFANNLGTVFVSNFHRTVCDLCGTGMCDFYAFADDFRFECREKWETATLTKEVMQWLLSDPDDLLAFLDHYQPDETVTDLSKLQDAINCFVEAYKLSKGEK